MDLAKKSVINTVTVKSYASARFWITSICLVHHSIGPAVLRSRASTTLSVSGFLLGLNRTQNASTGTCRLMDTLKYDLTYYL